MSCLPPPPPPSWDAVGHQRREGHCQRDGEAVQHEVLLVPVAERQAEKAGEGGMPSKAVQSTYASVRHKTSFFSHLSVIKRGLLHLCLPDSASCFVCPAWHSHCWSASSTMPSRRLLKPKGNLSPTSSHGLWWLEAPESRG